MKTIEVIDVAVEEQAKNGRTFSVMTVTYKDVSTGKIDAKKLFSFSADKNLWGTLKSASKGTVLSVEVEKGDRGYWEWTRMVDTPAKGNSTAVRPNWETPEERAARQLYIIRQSSIASAVEFLKDKTESVERVLTVAAEFEKYVLGKDFDVE